MNWKDRRLPLTLAVLLALGWIAWQRVEIGDAQRQQAQLLKSQSTREQREAGRQPKIPSGKNASTSTSIWKQFAKEFAACDPSDLRPYRHFRQLLLGMSAEELTAAIGQIQELDLPDKVKNSMLDQMIGVLAFSDPKAASGFCELLKNGRSNDAYNACVSEVLFRWSCSDALASAAWLDGLIDRGEFTVANLRGEHTDRCRLEANLAQALARTDLKAATERVKKLPEVDRWEIFSSSGTTANRQDAANWIAMAKASLPSDKRTTSTLGFGGTPLTGIISGTARNLYGTYGTTAVETFLKDIDCQPEERKASLATVFSIRTNIDPSLPAQDLSGRVTESMKWLNQADPEHADEIGAGVLASRIQGSVFQEMAQQAVDYSAAQGDDGLLVAFLSNEQVMRRPQDALPFVEKISDPSQRETLRQKLEEALSKANPPQ